MCVFSASAETYLKEALQTYEDHYGNCHEKTIDARDELARLLIRTERLEVQSIDTLGAIWRFSGSGRNTIKYSVLLPLHLA